MKMDEPVFKDNKDQIVKYAFLSIQIMNDHLPLDNQVDNIGHVMIEKKSKCNVQK